MTGQELFNLCMDSWVAARKAPNPNVAGEKISELLDNSDLNISIK